MTRRRRRTSRISQRREEALWGVIGILPSLVLLIFFVFIPAFYSIYISLLDWDMINPVRTFVGLDNYRDVITSERFWMAFRNTASYVLLSLPFRVVVALFLAWLITFKNRGRDFFRAVYFLPTITSTL